MAHTTMRRLPCWADFEPPASGIGSEGAVHAHTRKALQKGVTPDEIRHVVLLSITTTGFPAAQAARTWVEDILSK